MSEVDDREEVLRWIASRTGRYCVVRIADRTGTPVAALRGHLGVRDAPRADGLDFFSVEDDRTAVGLGQPGFVVPRRLAGARAIDDHGLLFTGENGVSVRVVLGPPADRR